MVLIHLMFLLKRKKDAKTEIVNKAENSSNPKIGDNIILYVAIAEVSFEGLVTDKI